MLTVAVEPNSAKPGEASTSGVVAPFRRRNDGKGSPRLIRSFASSSRSDRAFLQVEAAESIVVRLVDRQATCYVMAPVESSDYDDVGRLMQLIVSRGGRGVEIDIIAFAVRGRK